MLDPVSASLLIGAGLGFLGVRSQNAANAREAQRNREFQERMSSTAHQREVADLQKAGLHPMLSVNRGASSPSGSQAQYENVGEGAARGMATALAVAQSRANIRLTDAQAAQARAAAQETGVRTSAIQSKTPLELALLQGQIRVTDLTAQEKETLLPTLFDRARAEIEQTMGNVRSLKARALLDELEESRARNISKFEKQLGDKGPAVRLLLEVLRGVAPYRER